MLLFIIFTDAILFIISSSKYFIVSLFLSKLKFILLSNSIFEFIFDINNAIVDVEEYHYKAWLETLQNILGREFTFSFQYFSDKFHPKDPESIINYLSKTLKLDNYDEIMLDKNRRYINMLNQNMNLYN